jgi:hypothetical protein
MSTSPGGCELEDADGDAWDEESEEQWDDQLHRITRDGVYLGSIDAAHNLPALLSKGITHILMVRRLSIVVELSS